MEARRAVEGYQYCERIKSELIIAFKLLEEIDAFKGDELAGAVKLMSSFLEALLAEARIAHKVTSSRRFLEASERITEAARYVDAKYFIQAGGCLSEAVSSITSFGSEMVEILKGIGLL